MQPTIRSKEEFNAMMEEVDLGLRNEGVPIHARPIRAIGEVAKKLNISLPVAPLQSDSIPNLYESKRLSEHIYLWFDQRYGDRLKVDFSIGYSVIMVRGDAWLLKCPAIYGEIIIVCDRNLNKKYQNFVVNIQGMPTQKAILNLLRLIEKLPQGLANQLTDEEMKNILKSYLDAHNLFNAIHGLCHRDELALGAVTDFESSARFAAGNHASYGQSLWASLQAAEKMLKYFIKSKGEKFPNIHDLSKLVKQSHKLGLPVVSDNLLESVQCKAAVRYEQSNHTVEAVVNSHQGALQIALIVIKALFSAAIKISDLSIINEKPKTYDTIFTPGHFYVNPTLGLSYYCKSIVDGIVTMILVESYQHGHLFQVVFKLKIKYQTHYQEIVDISEINRLKQVGEKIFRDQGVIL